MRWFTGVLLTVLALAAFAVAPGAADPQGEETSTASVTRTVSAEVRGTDNPVPPTAESIARGEYLFASQCTMCHGSRGDGRGDLALRLELSMPDFTSEERQKKHTDGELFHIITNGHGRMPAEGERLPIDARWNMINYIRSLVTEP